jgi:hypothetical protein
LSNSKLATNTCILNPLDPRPHFYGNKLPFLHPEVPYKCFKNVPVWILVTRFEARNGISEPGPHETYRDIFLKHHVVHVSGILFTFLDLCTGVKTIMDTKGLQSSASRTGLSSPLDLT